MKTFTKEFVKEKLSNDNRWIERAIIVLYQKQTIIEQNNFVTAESNGVGFNYFDAKYFSYLANYLLKDKRNHLSGKHLDKAKKVLPKYWKQIISEIEQNQKNV